MKVIELREKAFKEAEAAREIKDKADEEGRLLTQDEADKVDAHLQKSEALEAEANRQERMETLEARLEKPQDRKSKPTIQTGEQIEVGVNRLFRHRSLRAFTGKDAEFEAYKAGKWCMATLMGDAAARQWCRDKGIEIRVQVEGTNTAGGFVVPDVMERAVINLREKYGVYRANSRVVPMGSDHTNIPRRTSGVTAYFIGETDDITASEKAWDNVELTAKKLGALVRMSTDLSEDSIINLADDLADEIAWAFAQKEDECGFNGTGTSTYGGMTGIRTKFVDGNHTAGQDAGTSPCTAWSHLTIDDEISTIMSLLPTYGIPRAKWYVSPAGKAGGLDRLALGAGGNTTRNIAEGAMPEFAGYPIVVAASMPSAPTNGTVYILFGDLSLASTFGDRRGITVKVTGERYIEYDQIGIQATERFCIVNHDIGDTSNAGPIVAGVGTT